MPFLFSVPQAIQLLLPTVALIRPELMAGPAIAATVGVTGWLVAGLFARRERAANDNDPRLAPLAPRR